MEHVERDIFRGEGGLDRGRYDELEAVAWFDPIFHVLYGRAA
jgi:hypothetical protein